MESLLPLIWIVFFVGLFVGVIFSAFYSSKYVDMLSKKHPERWRGIKNEGIIFGEIKTQFNLLKSIMKKEYLMVQDNELSKKGNKLRLTLLIYFPFCIAFLGLTLLILLS